MAWLLRTLAALPEDPGLLPGAHMAGSSQPRGSDALFWPVQVASMHVVPILYTLRTDKTLHTSK